MLDLRMSIGYQALIAALLGIFLGLFFGPFCEILRPIGDIYVMLLQMVGLPYICFSLIHGLGSITPEIGKNLFFRGWPFWILLWSIIFAIIFFLSLLIPKPLVAFIGNGTDGRDSQLAKNFISYLVPENPFYDLANNIVPAVAVFGLIVGVSLMHLHNKEPILSMIERSNQIIQKILKWLAILSPIGIFCHIAVATGTVYFNDLYAMGFYVFIFILTTLFVTFWILPVLISSMTPLTYREVMKAFHFVCLVPFATGLPTVGLPFISYYMKQLGEKQAAEDVNFHGTSQTVMPLCYCFGQIGNCMILFFILFLSFFYRHPFAASEKGLLALLTIPMSIGSSGTSVSPVSFLIQQLNFPPGSIELFTEAVAFTLNFQVLLSIASVLTFILLVLFSYYGHIQVKWHQLLFKLLIGFSLFGLLILGIKSTYRLTDSYANRYSNLRIGEVIEDPVHATILAQNQEGTPRSEPKSIATPLDEILRTGILKVGFDVSAMPYSYINNKNELVGFDIAYAYQLARDLDCILEFIPIVDFHSLDTDLNSQKYDIAMSAILMTESRLKSMDFTNSYAEENNVLIVPVQKAPFFADMKRVALTKGVKIGATGDYRIMIDRHFPLAEVINWDVQPQYDQEFEKGKIDAFAYSKTPGFVWCLSHPHYVVADYGKFLGKQFFSYPVASGSLDWRSFLNDWLLLKEQSGFKEEMTRYWIEGENPRERTPRWSIIRNVLHWVP